MGEDLPVDAGGLREEVRHKYRDVAVNPHGAYHFHTGRKLARRLGYDEAVVAGMPDSAVEAFACVFRRKSATDSEMKSAADSDLISAISI